MSKSRFVAPSFISGLTILLLLLTACTPEVASSTNVSLEEESSPFEEIASGFSVADGSRALVFPQDFGAHPDFRTEWWYTTGNLQTSDGRPFGFELTFFRVGLLPPSAELPDDSRWYNHSLYFSHFAVSDIGAEKFFAFERYARPGPGLAGAQAEPYRVWVEDWSVTEEDTGIYKMSAAQDEIKLSLTLKDTMGVILHGENGYSRKGVNISNASYYYSQPRLETSGTIQIGEEIFSVAGWSWKDHEFSTGVLDEDQVGWDWFSLQFEEGEALMLFQLRQNDGDISEFSSGTFISADGRSKFVSNDDFVIIILDEWRSPHSGGVYPSAWRIELQNPECVIEIHPLMSDQEINFSAFTYWEGAVEFEGTCEDRSVSGKGYVELTGYAGNLPLP